MCLSLGITFKILSTWKMTGINLHEGNKHIVTKHIVTHMYAHSKTDKHTHAYTHTHTLKHVCTDICTHKHTHTHIHTPTHTHTLTHTHTHTHNDTHITYPLLLFTTYSHSFSLCVKSHMLLVMACMLKLPVKQC